MLLSGKAVRMSIELFGLTKSSLSVNSLLSKMFVHFQTKSLYWNQIKLFPSFSELAQKINAWSLLII